MSGGALGARDSSKDALALPLPFPARSTTSGLDPSPSVALSRKIASVLSWVGAKARPVYQCDMYKTGPPVG